MMDPKFADHQPIQPEVREQMNAIGNAVNDFLNGDAAPGDRKWGFALLVFPFGTGDDHRSNYLSNADRETMLATLKEFIARAEGTFHESR